MSKALHHKAAAFVSQNLFVGLHSFTELENRIAALPDKQSRGDAFEVFAEAYLATQRRHEASHVWPLNAVPSAVLQQLNLASKDYGIDGVFQTQLGQFNTYQVKFRTDRPALTWSGDKLSNFFGLSDSPNASSRVLITNCDKLPSILKERQGFFCIRGSDLDRLEADDFRAIEAWLADSAFTARRKTPKQHQQEALAALLPALEQHDRVSAIMACGTGKTLVALWTVEQMQVDRVLVLVPSLALLRQLLHEWLRETSLPSLAYLCVCSDKTVTDGVDSISTAQSDLDFPVSTDAANVRGFLDAPFAGRKIVLSTYQSADVVGKALREGEAFDLAIFDEAHKTAGREGRNYAFALDDANLLIRKRLFFTATPRHYNPQQKDSEGEAQLVFSMDKPEVYGPQAYRLTFSEAARQGIICGYKVIISVITSDMVTNELLSKGEVMVQGDAVRARQVANQIALRDAVEKYGAKKIFTFHKTIDSAESFVAKGSEGIRTHLPDFKTFHVSGKMATAQREREMRDFRAASRAVMSNARCLTEGVDVPAVDMVAFLSPRRSRVDIVQAAGRAMRRADGKTVGYVLVPLYVEQAAGETVEEAVSRSDFDEVWDVLNSLQEQDDVLTEQIRYASMERGRGNKGFDDSKFSDRVEFTCPVVGLDTLYSAVATRCLDNICFSWETWFGKLKAFKERFGHCNVETGWQEDQALGSWVSRLRTMRSKGIIQQNRIDLLDQLGFVWDMQKDKWMQFFEELKELKERLGHCNIDASWNENPLLGNWAHRQRTMWNKGTLQQERIDLLEKIGFIWDFDSNQETWNSKFELLKSFKERFGHCNVVIGWQEDQALGSWVSRLRTMRNKRILQQDRIDLLDQLGFVWDFQEQKNQETWMKRYKELETYTKEHGNPHVPRTHANRKLANWVWIQRQRRKGTTKDSAITSEQIALLDKLNFRWDVREEQWQEQLEQLKQFKEQHGHCNVELVADEDDKLLGWVKFQRNALSQGKLDEDKKAQLDAIGFSWASKVFDAKWEEMYNRLQIYHSEYGNADVPSRWKEDLKLAAWVSAQRERRKKEIISDEQIQRLDALGFTWQHRERGAWEDRYQELIKFKEKYGHCNVPIGYKEVPKLGAFVNAMRSHKTAGILSQERIELLERIGFQWAMPKTDSWEDRYLQLLYFKEEHGHCNVAYNYPDNKQLGKWVINQRQSRKNSKLLPERERLLEEIGFQWTIVDFGGVKKTEVWDLRYQELLAFKQQYGHCNVPYNYSGNKQLGTWVINQRQKRKQNKLKPERERLLEEIGFLWSAGPESDEQELPQG